MLLALHGEPAHGYELAPRLAGLGFAEPDLPGLYRLLRELERTGSVRSVWAPGRAGPGRRLYRVTAKGTRQLREDAEALDGLADALRRFREAYTAREQSRKRPARERG